MEFQVSNSQSAQQCFGLVDYEDSDSENESEVRPNTVSVADSSDVCLNCMKRQTNRSQSNQFEHFPQNGTLTTLATDECQCGQGSTSKTKRLKCESTKDIFQDQELQDGAMAVDEVTVSSAKQSHSATANGLETDAGIVPRSTFSFCDDGGSKAKKMKLSDSDKLEQLSVPSSIQSMFRGFHQKWEDNPSEHEERIRSFPHVEGNWATHVFIQVSWNEKFFEFVNCLVNFLKPVPFHAMPEFHVSLSRTVPIRHHWIDPLVDSLRSSFKPLQTTISDLSAVRMFTNDEKTRTFLCLELAEEDTLLREYVYAVDKSFAEFRLPEYYENPSFHISIGWCLGDVTGEVSETKMTRVKEMFGEFIATYPDLSVVYVREICCKSGNKCFVIPLQEGHG
ncbi:U6 snRNA phosphodiesterase [Aplysia californica]|uniref:U6 snRNA phosphodiesterase n=1 Tax=Aplysia californica TaxID=6500 RepID=A0ABM0K516_APLCA|nr:U6 snRNA phosphodiesterase [Aplysia californica]